MKNGSLGEGDWLDITQPISHDMVRWPGQPQTCRVLADAISEGGDANVSILSMSMHSGTHMDAPRHFIEGGADIASAPLSALMGRARIAHITPHDDHVSERDLREYESRTRPLQRGDRLILRTPNSNTAWITEPFDRTYVALDEQGARYCVDRGVQCVGIDYLSIAPFDAPEPTHRVLLGADVWVVEGLNLHAIAHEQDVEMIALPLKIEGSDAAPMRVLVRYVRP